MATSYTTLLGFALPVTGELDGTWGTTVNDSITELVEDAIAATATQSVAGGDWTLTTTGSGATNQARCAIIIPTGTPGVSRNVIAPAQSKAYIVVNSSDAAIVFKASATTGVTIATGDRAVVAWNGSDFITIASNATDGVSTISFGTTGLTPSTATSGAVTVAGTLAVGNGGTGATSLTANNVILGNGTSAVQFVAPGANGNVLTSNGTTWASSTPAAGVSLSADNTWTGTQSFVGTTAKLSSYFVNAEEKITVSATAATGTINYDITTQSVIYYTSNAAANWTVNFRASSGTSLNTALGTGECVTVTFLVTQGSTAYYNSAVQVDGSSVTPKWQGGTAPTAGNASSIDAYVYTIVKTGAATFTVFASQTQFA